jgi:ferrous iron transport protein B
MELPEYHWPNLRNLLTGLWERTQIFLTRVGTIILAFMVLLWFLSSYPQPPARGHGPGHSLQLRRHDGLGLETIFKPDRLQLADQRGAGAGPGRA